MKALVRIYEFLGGIHFAILLITLAICFVIAGTLIESQTGSHLHAAYFTYSSPYFAYLLWGFFINIALSAARRWPFQRKHVPFLITHFGLLMTFGGAIVKTYYGLQGNMVLVEGGGSQELLLADTHALHLERRSHPFQKTNFQISLKTLPLQFSIPSSSLRVTLLEQLPHVHSKWRAWLFDQWAYFKGIDPIPVESQIELSKKIRYLHPDGSSWRVLAMRSEKTEEAIRQAYLQHLKIRVRERATGAVLFDKPLQEALDFPTPCLQGNLTAELQFNDPLFFKDFKPSLSLRLSSTPHEQMLIPLTGPAALQNLNLSTPHLGKNRIEIDLIQDPLIFFVDPIKCPSFCFCFDPYGAITQHPLPQEQLDKMIVYDHGFGGYATQLSIPPPKNRLEREQLLALFLEQELRQSFSQHSTLIPPLQMLKNHCAATNRDFPKLFVDFLSHWSASGKWICSENFIPLDGLTWEDPLIKKAAALAAHLFSSLTPQLENGGELLEILSQKRWPFIQELVQQTSEEEQLTALTQQCFQVAEWLSVPIAEVPSSALLSAYLKAYQIDLNQLLPISEEREGYSEFTEKFHLFLAAHAGNPLLIESPLIMHHEQATPSEKWEENIPKIFLQLNHGDESDAIALAYDRTGRGNKWPALGGEYLLRFQPEIRSLPYRVRLRQARQINYANSLQPFSYESQLIIRDQRTQQLSEVSLRMNEVYETWDGYRFYLANITPSDESDIHRVHLVVNYDPTKYWLTYPGAAILSLGMLLLFWRGGRKKRI